MQARKCGSLFLILLAPVLGFALVLPGCGLSQRSPDSAPPGNHFLLCFWNVENFFDDIDDGRHGPGDREYDPWFARRPDLLRLKLDHLSDALIKLNGGRGPDILCLAEVESIRAAELLRDALNQRLGDESLHYQNILMKDLDAGRHIAPAIITRLPVHRNKTRLLGRRQRILEGHVDVGGKDLVLIVAHWTSRLRKETAKQRANYADRIYGTFRGMYKSNPGVDLLICGDFNDTPNDPSVTEHLHATGDRQEVLASGEDRPLLLNLFAGKDPRDGWGTIYDRRRWSIFDQIVVSPGMLDEVNWSCDPDSSATVNTLVRPRDRARRPWRFGNPHDRGERGYSDHFPVTVRLQVH